MNRSLPQLGEDYNVWDESEGINDSDRRLVVPIICYHWLKINTGEYGEDVHVWNRKTGWRNQTERQVTHI